jgi:hypothetical protein
MLPFLQLEELTRSRRADLRLEAERGRPAASAAGSVTRFAGCLTHRARQLRAAVAAAVAGFSHGRRPCPTRRLPTWQPRDNPVPPVQRYPWGPPV